MTSSRTNSHQRRGSISGAAREKSDATSLRTTSRLCRDLDGVAHDRPIVTNPYDLAQLAANELRNMSGVDAYDVVVVLGSGWKEGAVALGTPSNVIASTSLSGFLAPTVAGHSGQILSLDVAGLNVALVSGRVHLYEGHSADQVVTRCAR